MFLSIKYSKKSNIMEKYNLTWHTYSDSLSDMLKELYTSLDYADVSIITEDRKELKAHKHILSFCSPVFKDILSITQEKCPVIYLRGIQHSEMESILQFMYLGEASFMQDRMNEFLLVANNLQIKELHKNIEIEDSAEFQDNFKPNEETLTENQSTNDKASKDPVPISESQPLVQSRDGKGGTCKPCGKYYANLKQHEMVKHSGVNHECPHCNHKSSTPANLRIHVKSKHEGAKFVCDECEYTASTKMGVKFHKDSVHLGKRYSCNECDKTFTQNQGLTRHKESVHSLNH